MKNVAPFVSAAVLVLTTGCSTSTFQAGRPIIPANGDSRLVIHEGGAPVHARITAVDATFNPNAFADRGLDLPPGEHTVELSLSGSFAYGDAALAFTAEPGRFYRVRSMQDGLGFRVRLWDETDGRRGRTLIAETKVPGGGLALPANLNAHYAEVNLPSYRMPTAMDNPLTNALPVSPGPL